MSKNKGKRRKRKLEVDRITIAFSNKRGILEPIRREQETQFPNANVKLDGRPGEWKVRRDRLSNDSADHRARNMRRYV